jgi:hypothetical protein
MFTYQEGTNMDPALIWSHLIGDTVARKLALFVVCPYSDIIWMKKVKPARNKSPTALSPC